MAKTQDCLASVLAFSLAIALLPWAACADVESSASLAAEVQASLGSREPDACPALARPRPLNPTEKAALEALLAPFSSRSAQTRDAQGGASMMTLSVLVRTEGARLFDTVQTGRQTCDAIVAVFVDLRLSGPSVGLVEVDAALIWRESEARFEGAAAYESLGSEYAIKFTFAADGTAHGAVAKRTRVVHGDGAEGSFSAPVVSW